MEKNRGTATIFFLCCIWFACSSVNNSIGKLVLSEFPYPMTVTMVQLLSITIYSGPFFNLFGIRTSANMNWRYYLTFIVPLAFGKFLSSVSSHWSIWKVPVSYAHTVKATMPLFTVILSRIIMREKQTMSVYLSLCPIIIGVLIATLTEISFDMVGLISALISTCGFSLQNIFSKKVLKETNIHHLRLLHVLGRLALIIFTPVWIFSDLSSVLSHNVVTNLDYRVLLLLFTDGVLNWLQNILAFSVLHLVTPLTYAVASASKRIFVIALSLFVLGNPVTWPNIFGMVLAIIGVLCYNRAKYFQRVHKTSLPSHANDKFYMKTPLLSNGKSYQNGLNQNLLFSPHNNMSSGSSMLVM